MFTLPSRLAPKIVLYGMGTIGQHLARFAIKKNWEIVAAFNRAGAKVGQDVGGLIGLGRNLGVVVQDADAADCLTLEADVALIATTDRMSTNWPAYERMLRRGINVLCHGVQCYQPWLMNRALTEKIDALAKEKGVTFSGSGIWDSTRFWAGLVAAGPCVEIDAIIHRSVSDVQRQGIHWLAALGTGMSVEIFHKKLVKAGGAVGGNYPQVPVAVLQRIGYTVTDVREHREPILFDEPYYCAALDRVLEPGTCIGTRVIIDVDTAEGTTGRCEIELRPLKEDEQEDLHWSILGRPTLHLRIRREQSGIASASSLFNRIPDVIAAAPGVHDLISFGPLRPSVFA